MKNMFISVCEKFVINVEEIAGIRVSAASSTEYVIRFKGADSSMMVPASVAADLIDFIAPRR